LPNQPNITRGTLILLAPNTKDANISASNVYFTFQYNPERLIHTYNQNNPNATSDSPADPKSAPTEFFNLTLELDSLEADPSIKNPPTDSLGLHPALAMLELMMQPQTVGNQTCLPIVVFRWGAKRSIPVRLVTLNVEEKTFDSTLNPTRATVNLTLRVLDSTEISNNQGARDIFTSHHNTQASLAGDYKQQTGQPPLNGAVTGASAPAAMASSGTQVTKKVNA
jgi:hypothetical protein